MSDLRALILCCTLKPAPAPSSSEFMARQVLQLFNDNGVEGELIRVADANVRFGVGIDEGDGDGWPTIRDKMLRAQILVIATPIWLGQPSAVCKLVLERLDAELGETNEAGQLLTYGKVATVAVVGNEDGAHHVCAEVFQALNDVGFTIPAAGCTYWVGEAMQRTDYQDAGPKPETTGAAMKTMVVNTVHLATLLNQHSYPVE